MQYAQQIETLKKAWRDAFAPPDRRPIYDWAHDNLDLPPAFTRRGRFDVSVSRHFIGPFEALQNDRVREVNIQAPVRSGKTLIADIWLPWVAVNDPGSFRWVFQEATIAKEHCETRAMPVLFSCPHVEALLPHNRHKLRNQEILFNNGMFLSIDGPNIARLQSKGFRYVVCDEPWLYPPGRLEEARGRLGDFLKLGISKFLCISQGGVDQDDWDFQFRGGELNEWTVECARCSKFMLPLWSGFRSDGSRWGMRFDEHKLPSGDWDIPRVLPTVRFECQHCGHPHIDNGRTKSEWNRTGKYQIIGEPRPHKKSFHWSAIIDFPWDELVDAWLRARNAARLGILTPTIQFFQKRMASTKSEGSVLEQSENLSRAVYEINSPWPEEYARCLSVDRQDEDVYWVTVRAWAKTGESRRLCFKRCYSTTEIEKLREDFKVPPNRVMIDSGFRARGDQGVYAACVRYGWTALKGTDDYFFWHTVKDKKGAYRVQRSYAPLTYGDPGSGTASQGKSGTAKLIRFSSPTASDRVKALIDRGLWIEPATEENEALEDEYRTQMSAEYKRLKRNPVTGRTESVWVCPSGNNHAFDLAKMQVIFATLVDILPDQLGEAPPISSEPSA